MIANNYLSYSITIAFAVTLIGCASSSDFEPQTLTLPDLNFAPEGITVSQDGTFYTGSLTQGRIISINQSNEVVDLVPADSNGLVSAIGIQISNDERLLYVCSSDPGFRQLTESANPALLTFDRLTGEAVGRYELPGGMGLCNDITILPNGTVLATDSFRPRIYSLKPGATELEVWLEDDRFAAEGFNLNGIAYDSQSQSVFVVRYNTGSFHRITIDQQGLAVSVNDISLSNPINGPDGLTALGGGRFLIVEGGGLNPGNTGNLLAVTVNGNAAVVDVLATNLNIPTTTAVHNGYAYVVEGQLDHLVNPDAGATDPYQIVPVRIPSIYL